MEWYWIVIITLAVYWSMGIVVSQINQDWMEYWAVGLMFPILWVLLYPVRAMLSYSRSIDYYKKHGITRLQFLFGKRVRRD